LIISLYNINHYSSRVLRHQQTKHQQCCSSNSIHWRIPANSCSSLIAKLEDLLKLTVQLDWFLHGSTASKQQTLYIICLYIYNIYIWGKCSNKHVKFWFVFKTSYAFGHWNYVRSEICLVQYLDLLDWRAHKKQTHLFGLAKRGIPIAKKNTSP